MYIGKVEVTGVNTGKLLVLKEKEKRELLKKAREGDEHAREQMISGNLRLVLSVVQKFLGRGENPDDLFQVGCIGLIKAIDNFDIEQNVRFSTYGVPMIIGEIRRYLRDNNSVRVSRSVRDTAYKALGIREKLTSQNQIDLENLSESGNLSAFSQGNGFQKMQEELRRQGITKNKKEDGAGQFLRMLESGGFTSAQREVLNEAVVEKMEEGKSLSWQELGASALDDEVTANYSKFFPGQGF